MDYIKEIRKKAAKNPKHIILPEGEESRIIRAAKKIADLGIARVTLLGDRNSILKKIGKTVVRTGKVDIINPARYEGIARIANSFYALRKRKGLSLAQAKKIVESQKVYCAAMMVRLGIADGFVAGAAYTTRNVARAAIHCLEKEKGINVVSSAFIMSLKNTRFGQSGTLVFADCGIVPNPDYKQLAEIAVVSARLTKSILGIKPMVAMLSYSTKGSASGELVDKVVKATKEAKRIDPSLDIDGELQLDSALVGEVARIKAAKSNVAGKANVLIFPNLDSGNIAYKLTQRLAGARAVGPVLQGLTRPASDLSRGSSVEDIVDTVAVTCVRAQH